MYESDETRVLHPVGGLWAAWLFALVLVTTCTNGKGLKALTAKLFQTLRFLADIANAHFTRATSLF